MKDNHNITVKDLFEGFQNRMKAKMKTDSETNFTPDDAINYPQITLNDSSNKILKKYEDFLINIGLESSSKMKLETFKNKRKKPNLEIIIMNTKKTGELYVLLNLKSRIYPKDNSFRFLFYLSTQIKSYGIWTLNDITLIKNITKIKNNTELTMTQNSLFNKFMIILKNMNNRHFQSLLNNFYHLAFKYKKFKPIATSKSLYSYSPLDMIKPFLEDCLFPEWNIKNIQSSLEFERINKIFYNELKNKIKADDPEIYTSLFQEH